MSGSYDIIWRGIDRNIDGNDLSSSDAQLYLSCAGGSNFCVRPHNCLSNANKLKIKKNSCSQRAAQLCWNEDISKNVKQPIILPVLISNNRLANVYPITNSHAQLMDLTSWHICFYASSGLTWPEYNKHYHF